MCSVRKLTFRELELGAGGFLAVFLAFLHTGVASQQAGLFERQPIVRACLKQRFGDTMAEGVGLGGFAAPSQGGNHVVLLRCFRYPEWFDDSLVLKDLTEIRVSFHLVDYYLAGPGGEPDSGYSILSLPGGIKAILSHN